MNLTHKNVAAARVFGLTQTDGLGVVMTLIRRMDTDGDHPSKMLSIGTHSWVDMCCCRFASSRIFARHHCRLDSEHSVSGLLVNILEESKEQRTAVRDMGDLNYLVDLYLHSHEAMCQQPDSDSESYVFARIAGTDSITSVTSYMALLLGCLVRDEETNRTAVLSRLPSTNSRLSWRLTELKARNFDDLITRIGYFIAHQLDNGALSREAHRSVCLRFWRSVPRALLEPRLRLIEFRFWTLRRLPRHGRSLASRSTSNECSVCVLVAVPKCMWPRWLFIYLRYADTNRRCMHCLQLTQRRCAIRASNASCAW